MWMCVIVWLECSDVRFTCGYVAHPQKRFISAMRIFDVFASPAESNENCNDLASETKDKAPSEWVDSFIGGNKRVENSFINGVHSEEIGS